MYKFSKPILTGITIAAITASGSVAAFSFGESFNESWGSGNSGSSWGTPDWGTSYSTPNSNWRGQRYYPGPGNYNYPPVSPYDRNQMRERRQVQMSDHDDSMDSLADMLFGKFRFDREEAIELAQEIEASSGQDLLRNFHPGAVATHDSRTAPALWGNEKAFKSYANAMRLAAVALAEELKKRPKAEEGALYPRRSRGFEYRRSFGNDADPIAPTVFEKFNKLSSTCQTCHSYFRIPGW